LSRANGALGIEASYPSEANSQRNGSPAGGSTLTTSAPQSAIVPPTAGPATHTPSSTTDTPSSTLVMGLSQAQRRRGGRRDTRGDFVCWRRHRRGRPVSMRRVGRVALVVVVVAVLIGGAAVAATGESPIGGTTSTTATGAGTAPPDTSTTAVATSSGAASTGQPGTTTTT